MLCTLTIGLILKLLPSLFSFTSEWKQVEKNLQPFYIGLLLKIGRAQKRTLGRTLREKIYVILNAGWHCGGVVFMQNQWMHFENKFTQAQFVTDSVKSD